MSSDQLFASAAGATATAHGAARDQVVVPLQQARDPINQGAPRLGGARLTRIEPSHSAPAASVVTQITDYRPVRRSAALAGASAPSPRSRAGVGNSPLPAGGIARHVDALDRQLRQHIETHLDLIAARAPDLGQPVENIRRSVELLLKLPRR